jgi:hypothetical protein
MSKKGLKTISADSLVYDGIDAPKPLNYETGLFCTQKGGHETGFCDLAKYKIGRNKILISRNLSRFRKIIWSIFREISQNCFSISRNFVE